MRGRSRSGVNDASTAMAPAASMVHRITKGRRPAPMRHELVSRTSPLSSTVTVVPLHRRVSQRRRQGFRSKRLSSRGTKVAAEISLSTWARHRFGAMGDSSSSWPDASIETSSPLRRSSSTVVVEAVTRIDRSDAVTILGGGPTGLLRHRRAAAGTGLGAGVRVLLTRT
ncbi:MAG: hypothetical protein M5U19_07560 [Microthrixaceae bacterium]|nr:hypothetical protein [Microthrixaceae bacterium]